MSISLSEFLDRLQSSLEWRYKQCPPNIPPDSVLLAVLNAVAEARAVEKTEPKDIGSMLREARKALDLSLADVASQSGVSTGQLSELERGKQTNPSLDTMRKLNPVLGLKPEDWFK